MKRVVVIGNSGGGKSTLARKLSVSLGLPFHELDALLWQPDWTLTPEPEYNAAHDAIIAQDTWVLDGVGIRDSIARRIEHADTIILIDLPFWMHCWLVAERQISWRTGPTENMPGGHQKAPPTKAVFENLHHVNQEWMPHIRQLTDEAERNEKTVWRLTSLEDVDTFTEEHASAKLS